MTIDMTNAPEAETRVTTPHMKAPWLRYGLHVQFCLFFLALCIMGAFALYLAGLAVFMGLPGVLGFLCLIGLFTESNRQRLGHRAAKEMMSKGAWLNWKLDEKIWAAHARKVARKKTKMTLIFALVVGGVLLLVGFVVPLIDNGFEAVLRAPFDFDPQMVLLAAILSSIFIGIGLVIDTLEAIINAAVAKKGNVAIIGPQGVIIGGAFMALSNSILQSFQGVRITKEPPVLELYFSQRSVTYSPAGGAISVHHGKDILSLPIPEGWEDDAIRVRDALGELPG